MAFTKVQIISNALCMLGQKPIIALQNQSDIVTAAEQAFDFLYPAALSVGQWRFATRIVLLTQLAEVPIVTYWTYIYQLPADYLRLVRQYPHNYDYEMYLDNKMYSNINNPLYLEYGFLPEISRLPAPFCEFLACKVASYLSLSNAQYTQYAAPLAAEAALRLSIAQAADAQNRPNTPLISQPVISNRSVGGFYSNSG